MPQWLRRLLDLLSEWLGGINKPDPDPPPTPTPSPEPDPDPVPTPSPEPDPDPTPTPEPDPDPDPTPGLTNMEQRIVNAVNAHRRNNGRDNIDVDMQLMQAARKHATWMARNDTMSHTGENNSRPADRIADEGYRWSAAGENIAMGYRDAESAVNGWKNSPGHNRIMLSNYEHIGVGVTESARTGKRHWCAVFANPRSSVRSGEFQLVPLDVEESGPLSE